MMSGNDLPLLNACLNALSTVFLALGLYFIKSGRRVAHKRAMLSAFVTSGFFLVGYLIHKIFIMKGVNTPFAGPTFLRVPYLVLLASHVLLAMTILPLAMVTIVRGLKDDTEKHRRIARWTWPLWMYVSVTGVLVYLILYQIWPAPGK